MSRSARRRRDRRRTTNDTARAGRVVQQRWLARADLLPVTVIALAAGVSRLAWVAIVKAQPVSDFLFYYRGAVNIATGAGYSIRDHATAFFPVGYPALLAAVFKVAGTDTAVMKLTNVALWVVAAVLAYVLGKQVAGRTAGIVAGAIVACYPEYIVYSGLGASENLMVPLLLGTVVVLAGAAPGRMSGRRAALAGALLGAAILVRSTALPLPLLFVAYLLVRGRSQALRPAAALLGVCTLVVLPWVVRNQVNIGAPVTSTNGGYTLWMGLNPDATGGSTIKGGNLPWPIDSAKQERLVNSELQREAVRYALENPGDALALVPKKTRLLFRWAPGILVSSSAMTPPDGSFGRTIPRTKKPLDRDLLLALRNNDWIFKTLHAIYLVTGTIGLVLALGRRRPAADWVTIIIVFWIVFHITLVHGQTRFLVSVTPLLAPFVGYLAVSVVRALRPRSRRSRGGAAAV